MISSRNSEICAVVLAGGKSSRLGRDKARVVINGRTLLERTLSLAAGVCSRTYCVGRNTDFQGINSGWMLDEVPGLGPMGGIVTALKTLDSPCLVLACDLPLLDRALITRLLEYRETHGKDKYLTTFKRRTTGFIEALVSVYEPRSLGLLKTSISRGCYQLSRAIPEEYRCHIHYGPEEEKYFYNVNYPQDLDKLKQLVSTG